MKPSSARLGLRSALALSLFACFAACSKNSDGGAPAPNTVTLHYHRAAADYSGWQVATTAGAVETSATSSSSDGFGAIYTLTLKPGAPSLAFSLVNGASTDAAGALTVDTSGTAREAWVISGWAEAIKRKLPALPDATHLVIYYARADKAYDGWGLHLWGDQVANTQYASPVLPVGIDPEFGAAFQLELKGGAAAGNCPSGNICLIAHNVVSGNKDQGTDVTNYVPATMGHLVFLPSGAAAVTQIPQPPALGNAHLIARDTVAWKVPDAHATVELRYSATASIVVTPTSVSGGSTLALQPAAGGLTAAQLAFAPYLAGFSSFTVGAADLPRVADALKGQLVAVARAQDGSFLGASAVQTAWAIEDLYLYDGPLGVTFASASDHTPTFQLWAPTAQAVKLHVADSTKTEIAAVAMTAGAQGLWSTAGQAAWYGGYYRYEVTVYAPSTGHIETVTVTDPYAVNLSTNGIWDQIIDLNDPATRPAGWDALVKPPLAADWAPTDIVLYETHMRDFSASDLTVPAERRGKYLAFATDSGAAQSDGLKHLQSLAQAGLTHVHMLPVFDLATVDEDPANRVDLDQPFSALCANTHVVVRPALCTQFGSQTIRAALGSLSFDSQLQAEITGYLKNVDSFNWGYDPFHYGAPEGSYASTADGAAKVLEFRAMVKGLSDIGLRFVLDVVYNHTNAGGIADKSVLDKIVPGYYHRLDPSGSIYNSTCCSNTATERHMMERVMSDTAVQWAKQYKVDGFRFDLMGHQPKAAMVRLRDRLAALTLARDGVDGAKIYLYGEGWDFGEVAKNALFVNASQLNLGGTGIGTFNDRMRDGLRGGGPFDDLNHIRLTQGFASGLYNDRNEFSISADTDKATLGKYLDWIRAGMAGNLADFRLVAYDGAAKTASSVDYNGAPTAYTQEPQEVINYAAVHDNQNLFDILNLKLPIGSSMATRVRYQDLALDAVMLGQGVPFVFMGDELLRSKSEDGNSYDSGDWFNRVDFTFNSTGWATGLPFGMDALWGLIDAIYKDTSIAPARTDILSAKAHFQELLSIRKSSRLFRLSTKADVLSRVDFLNAGAAQVPGVIVMTVTDGSGCTTTDLDPRRDGVVAILNGSATSQTVTVPGASGFTLHAVQQASADPTVRTASVSGTTFTVPARTTAVFEALQSAARGAGLPCNTH